MRSGKTGQVQVGLHPQALAIGVIPSHIELLAVANREDGTVSVINTATFRKVATVRTGAQPAALAFTDRGRHLLVVDSLSDRLVDVNTSSWRIDATLSVRAPSGLGAAPSALAVNTAGTRIYVALSQDNAVAVVGRKSSGRMSLLGRIPTAVYPTSVSLDSKHSALLVTAGKGVEQGAGVPAGHRLAREPHTVGSG